MDQKEVKATVTESIPSQVIDHYKSRNQSALYDENNQRVIDENGNYAYKIDTRRVKEAIKNFAKTFASRGISLEDINFDEYLLEGYTIDKAPSKCLTVVYSDREFYIRDKRTGVDSDNSIWWISADNSGRMTRDRDHRWVSVEKIPDSQLLGKATYTWVIPEEVLKTDVKELRTKRRESQVPSKFRRYKPSEDPSKKRSWHREAGSYLDKSGYLVDKSELREKLSEYKQSKLKNRSIESLLQEYSEGLMKIAEFCNQYIKRGMEALNLLVESSGSLRGGNNFIGSIEDVKGRLKEFSERPSKYAARFKEVENDPTETENLKNRLTAMISELSLESMKKDDWSIGRLIEYVEQLEKNVEDLKNKPATEGLRGHYSHRTLQATEGHFVSGNILSAFEGD